MHALHPHPLFAALAVLALGACATSTQSSGLQTVEAQAAEVQPAPACPADATVMQGWDDRAPPRKIFGNTWYVGTCGIAAILIVGQDGAILIDGATEKGAPAILANIEALGLDRSDVKLLLNTHEHSDHAGGLAELQRLTGAPVLARAPAVDVLKSGAAERSDPQFDVLDAFPPIADVRTISNDHVVRLGELELTVHATPGHAPGGTSWTWRACEASDCRQLAYIDSHGVASDRSYRFSDHPQYVAAFQASIERVATLPCDILITPHPLASNLPARLDGKAPLVDEHACQRFAATADSNLSRRLNRER